MLRLVLALFLAGVCSAELSHTELAEYGGRLFNECTLCNIAHGFLTIPGLMDEIREISPELAQHLSKYESDCTPLCTSPAQACDALQVLSKEILGPVYYFFGEDAITPILNLLGTFADPVNSCGIPRTCSGDPTMQIMRSRGTRGQRMFLEIVTACGCCRVGMYLIHMTVTGGQMPTSKKIIEAAGKGLTNLCIKIKIPELMSKISRILGKVDVCGVMPKVANIIFTKGLDRIFTAPMAGKICGKLIKGCVI